MKNYTACNELLIITWYFLQRQSDEKVGEKHAFELLFLHAGLELFSDTEGATESLQVGVS